MIYHKNVLQLRIWLVENDAYLQNLLSTIAFVNIIALLQHYQYINHWQWYDKNIFVYDYDTAISFQDKTN